MTIIELGSLALRITVVIGAAAVVNSARQRANAGSRHWLWMFALAGVVILPLAQRAAPPVRVLPWRDSSPVIEMTAPPANSQIAGVAFPESRAVQSVTQVEQAPTTVEPQAGAKLSTAMIILIVWSVGAIALLARLFLAHLRARAVVRRSRPLSMSSAVETRLSAEVEMPFTYGLVRQVIVMPEAATSWAQSQLNATLLHEESHAARGDTIALLVSQMICAIYWWHPAVWYAARCAAAERERACDDAVIRHGVRASEYGQCLLSHAQSLTAWRASPVATVMFGHSAGLGARVVALLDPAIDRSAGLKPKVRVVGGMAALVVVAGAAAPRTVASVTDAIAPAKMAFAPVVSMAMLPGEQTSANQPARSAAATSSRIDVPAAGVCRQSADTRNSKTYRDAIVRITGAGSRTDNGVTREIWTGVDCIAWMEFNKGVDASNDERTMVVDGNGRFTAHNEGPDGTREYRLTGSSTSMTLNGSNVAIGPAEEAWVSAMAREFLRRTGARAEQRAHVALSGGGTRGLLGEVALIPRGRTRVEYLREGFAATNSPESVVSYIHDAAALLDSSDNRGAFLVAVPHKYDTNVKVLQAIFEEASVIEPDGAVEEVLRSYPPPRPLPQSLTPLIEKMIAGLQTSERRAALKAYYLGIRP